jgi:hypothetical protein
MVKGRFATKGRMEYLFKAIGSYVVLSIEMKLKDRRHLDAVAQVMAECNGKAYVYS